MLSVGLAADLLGSAHAAADDMTPRLTACAGCHGPSGEGVKSVSYVPHLSGKPAGYLLDQLQAFRDGRRHYPPMVWLVRNLDDDYLRAIAAFYASQTPLTRADVTEDGLSATQRARAEQLALRGDAATGMQACAACHGARLTGLEPGIPALVGLPADYIVAQLGAWRAGVRAARPPDCMHDIALQLGDSDMRVLGQWLAAQGHTDQQRPAPAGTFALPTTCGAMQVSEEATGTAPP